MKKAFKITLPVVAALIVALAVSGVQHKHEGSCGAPLVVFGSLFGCGDSKQPGRDEAAAKINGNPPVAADAREGKAGSRELKVTFVEIGSVNCLPCKMMQPIMKAVEDEYAGQVKVVFYDVWTPEGRPYGMHYGVRVIPTQIFLDKDGNEYFRHEGFFSKEDLVDVLKMKGVR